MREKIAIIGGTGKEGKGLAYRWAKAGHHVIIGSRSLEKAQAAAAEVNELLKNSGLEVQGAENLEAAEKCEIITLTVPFQVHKDMLLNLKETIAGKLLIDVTVPLVPPKVTTAQMPDTGSAGLEGKQIIGENARIVTAFQNISYERLIGEDKIDCDVLVCGTSKDDRQHVIQLVFDAGMVGWDAGPLENSMVIEGLTSILIGINKKYGSSEAGIRITGVEQKR